MRFLLMMMGVATWVFDDSPTVYNKATCDNLWNYATFYESIGVEENYAMGEYRKNCH